MGKQREWERNRIFRKIHETVAEEKRPTGILTDKWIKSVKECEETVGIETRRS